MAFTTKPKVAFVTGGNGITGTAIIEHLVHETTKEEWSDIIVTSRSPFATSVQDPRIKFIALDFTKDSETLAKEMADLCHPVTHAYFSSYVHKDDFQELNSANQALFENFLSALVKASPNLASVALQTGGKYYNVSRPKTSIDVNLHSACWHIFLPCIDPFCLQVHTQPVPSPAHEDAPRLVSFEQNFYFPQEDFLVAKQKNSNWTWTVIRPEAIIGEKQSKGAL